VLGELVVCHEGSSRQGRAASLTTRGRSR
jgi:hypothetical protein